VVPSSGSHAAGKWQLWGGRGGGRGRGHGGKQRSAPALRVRSGCWRGDDDGILGVGVGVVGEGLRVGTANGAMLLRLRL
jgi:hypothetical protein